MISAPPACTAAPASIFANAPIHATRAGEYGRILVVPVRVDGRGPFFFFLDTGATTTTVGTRGARYIGLDATTASRGTGATGSIAVQTTTASLAFGGRTVEHVRVAVAEQFDELHRIAPGVIGSLGLNALRGMTLAIDYRSDNVYVSDERLPAWLGLPIVVGRGLYADAQVNGRPIRAYIDTGAEVDMLGESLAGRLQLTRFRGTPMTGVGGTGVQDVDEALVRRIQLAGIERVDTVATVSPQIAALSNATGVPFDAILGYPIFGATCAVFDFPGQRALLD
jgi:predicted aspartyl protease